MSNVIRSLVVRVGADVSGFNQATKNLSRDLGKLSKNFTTIGTNLTKAITLPVAGIAAASFQLAADMEDAMGAAAQIYGNYSKSVIGWAKELESYYGIASTEALTYANTMGAMLQNIGGMSEEEAAKQAQKLVELAGDLTAMFGGTTESAVQALTGALKGNNAMLDNYGMGVNDATIKAKAMEMGLIKEGESLTLVNKQAATLALIMEQTGDAQGQAAREAEGASGSLRTLKTDVKNLATNIGDVLIPIVVPLIDKANELVTSFAELDEETRENIVKGALLAATLGPAFIIMGKVAGAASSIATFLSKATAASKGVEKIGPRFLGINPALGATLVILTGIVAAIVELNRQKEIWDNILGGQGLIEKDLNSVDMATRYGTDYANNSGSTQGVAYGSAYQNLMGIKPNVSPTTLGRGGTRPEDLKTTIDVGGVITIKGDTSKEQFNVASQRAKEAFLNNLAREERRNR